MSWRALGAPKDMVNMLVNMDKGGRTTVILAPGRTTESILGNDGTYANARGVRQGSVCGEGELELRFVYLLHTRQCTLFYVVASVDTVGYPPQTNTPLLNCLI